MLIKTPVPSTCGAGDGAVWRRAAGDAGPHVEGDGGIPGVPAQGGHRRPPARRPAAGRVPVGKPVLVHVGYGGGRRGRRLAVQRRAHGDGGGLLRFTAAGGGTLRQRGTHAPNQQPPLQRARGRRIRARAARDGAAGGQRLHQRVAPRSQRQPRGPHSGGPGGGRRRAQGAARPPHVATRHAAASKRGRRRRRRCAPATRRSASCGSS